MLKIDGFEIAKSYFVIIKAVLKRPHEFPSYVLSGQLRRLSKLINKRRESLHEQRYVNQSANFQTSALMKILRFIFSFIKTDLSNSTLKLK